MLLVEVFHLGSATIVLALLATVLQQARDVPIEHGLMIRSLLSLFVQVDLRKQGSALREEGGKGSRGHLSDVIEVEVELGGDLLEVVLGNNHTLRPSEAAIGRVGDGVRLAAASADVDVGDPIRILDVSDCTIADTTGDYGTEQSVSC